MTAVRGSASDRGRETSLPSSDGASSSGSHPGSATGAAMVPQPQPQPLPGAPPQAPRRRIHAPCGTVEGWIDGEVLRATGIRYARSARFGEPDPEPDAAGILDATAWSPAAPPLPELDLAATIGG